MNLRRCSFLGLALAAVLYAGSVKSAASPQLPFSFVENRGQIDSRFRYIGNGPEFRALFHENGVVFARGSAHTALRFLGAAENTRIELSSQMNAKTNYLLGSDASRWIKDLDTYDTLKYVQVWPGVNVVYRGVNGEVRADYEINSPEVVSRIQLGFDGRPDVQSDGRLRVKSGSADFTLEKPTLCLAPNYSKCTLQADFFVKPDGTVALVNVANISAPVDQRILFSGYFGGTSQTTITGVAINSYYNTVVTGWTAATDLPATGGAQTQSGGGIDAFVAAFNPAGGGLIYCTYLGGAGADEASGISVDGANNTYITGWTSSSNFPVTKAIQTRLSGARDAFIAKLTPGGDTLVYSTYLGGSGVDTGNAIKVDSAGASVIAGDTTSANLPVTPGVVQSRLKGGQDAFVAKLTPTGTLQVLTYFGGSGSDHAATIALDASGGIYLGGSTYSVNFPVLNAAQPVTGGGQDGFVSQFSASATVLVFSTYVGGSGGGPSAPEQVNSIVIPPGGSVITAGVTSSRNFPVSAGSLQPFFGGGQTDGFVARYQPTTGVLQRSTFFGGSGDDCVNAIATDILGTIYATGYTTSTDFPALNATQSSSGGAMDAFLAKFNAVHIYYSTYLGGTGMDSGNAIATDSMTGVIVAGSTSSPDFPCAGLTSPEGTSLSGFITRVAPNFTLSLVSSSVFYFDVWHDTGFNGASINLNVSSFGNAGDIPVSGDWDGTGRKRIGVFRNGLWLLDINGNGVFDAGDRQVTFGTAGDIPVVGDWDGTGSVKLGLFRQGIFMLDYSGHLSGVPTGLADRSFAFGMASDLPVVADWNHSGTSKVGVFRAGQWLVDYNGDQLFDSRDRTYSYGQAGDQPVVGDWDSSGQPSRIGVYRHGVWILDYDGDNVIGSAGQWELHVFFGNNLYSALIM